MINTGTDNHGSSQHVESTSSWLARTWCGCILTLGLLTGCNAGDQYLRDGGITRSLTGQDNSSAGPVGSGLSSGGAPGVSEQSRESRQVASLLEDALEFLRSGEPRASLDKLLEAQMIDGWEQTPKAPAVVFWTGHSYELVNEPNAAIAAFRRVKVQYKASPFAQRATRRLQRLRRQLDDDRLSGI